MSRTFGTTQDGTRWLAFPFPLRRDVTCEIVIPRDMTKAEADRLAAFIESLPVPTKAEVPTPTVPRET